MGPLIGSPLLAVGIDFAAVVLLTLGGVADDLVGRGNLLEPLLRGSPIGRIEVGVQLLGKLAVGTTDIVIRRVPLNAQHLVGVFGHLQLPIPARSR